MRFAIQGLVAYKPTAYKKISVFLHIQAYPRRHIQNLV